MTQKDRDRIKLFWLLHNFKKAKVASCGNCIHMRINNPYNENNHKGETISLYRGQFIPITVGVGNGQFCDYYKYEPTEKNGEYEKLFKNQGYIAGCCENWQFNWNLCGEGLNKCEI